MNTNRGHWATRAACAARPELPWTTDTHRLPAVLVETMASICHACPVALDCLNAVDSLDVTGGFWAGADRDPHTHESNASAPLVWLRLPGAAGAEQAAFDFTTLGGAA